MRLAEQTKALIEKSIEVDQGTAYRKYLQDILPKIKDAYRPSDDGYRSHLGASLIGRDCAFELWLSFRWTERSQFPERILRLFNRGHLEEAHFLAMILSAGIEVWYETENGGQFRFSDVEGHFGSSLDGVIKIPELDGAPAYAEFKTHNDKSFKKLVKEGMQNSKYEHYVQMQECMHANKLPYGVYFAVNKNDDTIHIEIIEYDQVTALRYLERARMIVYANDAPARISNRKDWWQCKFCNKKDICHNKKVPDINCRTCAHSTAYALDCLWSCQFTGDYIDKELAPSGCKHHVFNPHLMPSVVLIGGIMEENYLELKLSSGKIIKQGPNHIRSQDLKL